jgi:hypothetical protein
MRVCHVVSTGQPVGLERPVLHPDASMDLDLTFFITAYIHLDSRTITWASLVYRYSTADLHQQQWKREIV